MRATLTSPSPMTDESAGKFSDMSEIILRFTIEQSGESLLMCTLSEKQSGTKGRTAATAAS